MQTTFIYGLKPPSPKGRKMSEETKQKIRIKALEREKKKRELMN